MSKEIPAEDEKDLLKSIPDIEKKTIEQLRDYFDIDDTFISVFDDKAIQKRVATVSGHMTSIKNMVQNHDEVENVLHQLTAVEGAIRKLKRDILKQHIRQNVEGDKDLVTEDRITYIEELLDRYMR